MFEALATGSRNAVALFFLAAGLFKLWRPAVTSDALAELKPLRAWRKPIVVLLASIEVTIAVLLMATDTLASILAATILLFIFSAFLFYLSRHAPSLPCGCLGEMSASSDHRVGIGRNVVLIALLTLSAFGPRHSFDLADLLIGVEFAVLVALSTDGVSFIRLIRIDERT